MFAAKKNNKNQLQIFAALFIMIVLVAPQALASSLEFVVGSQAFVRTDSPIVRAAMGDEKVAAVLATNKYEIRVQGVAAGRTNLSVWVKDARLGAKERRMDFSLHVRPDLKGLRKLLVRDPKTQGVTVLADGSHIILEGKVPSKLAHEKVEKLAKLYAGENYVDLIEITAKKMVSVEVKFAAVSTSTLKALGFDFRALGSNVVGAVTTPASVTGLAFTGGNAASLQLVNGLPINDAFNLMFGSLDKSMLGILSALDSTDLAQILAEPTLQVRSGEKAEFLAGGEIPVPVPQSGSSSGAVTIEFKPYGVKLDIEPTVLEDDRIELKVAPEVSELDYGNSISLQGFNVPAVRQRSTKTTVELQDGQSFVLAGLMMNTTANIEEKIPGLGDLPVIGALFKRVRNQREQQELIIVATPRLVDATDMPEPSSLPGQSRADYDPSLLDILLDRDGLDENLAEHGLLP